MTASRTTPTLWVLVIMMGPSRNPESSSQMVPVISPLPLSVNHAPKTASLELLPRGRMAVTPVRTGPSPTFSLPLAGDERRFAYFYAFDVGDGVVCAGRAVEGDAQIAGSGLGLGDGESGE